MKLQQPFLNSHNEEWVPLYLTMSRLYYIKECAWPRLYLVGVRVSRGGMKCHDKMVYNSAMIAKVSWSSSLVAVDLVYPDGGRVIVGRNALLDKWVRSLADGIIYCIYLTW